MPYWTGSKFRAFRDSLWYFIMLMQSDLSVGARLAAGEGTPPVSDTFRGRDEPEATTKAMYTKIGIMHRKFLEAYSTDGLVNAWPALAATPPVIPKVVPMAVMPAVMTPAGLPGQVGHGGGGSGGHGGGGGSGAVAGAAGGSGRATTGGGCTARGITFQDHAASDDGGWDE